MSQTQRKSEFWRSLNEREFMREHDGVPPMPSAPEPARWDELDRRNFLRFMGASMALGGLTACTRQPLEKIVPYVKPPEEAIPGKPLFFASTCGLGGYGQGVLVESHLGSLPRLRASPTIPQAWGARTCVPRPQSLISTIPTVRRHRGRITESAPGRPSLPI